MRSRFALAAALAVSSVAGQGVAGPLVPAQRRDMVYGGDLPIRSTYALRVAQLPDDHLGVTIDLSYPAADELPASDQIAVGALEPSALAVSSDGGHMVPARILRNTDRTWRLEIEPRAGQGDRGMHVRFEQSPPRPLRFGWRHAFAELRWTEHVDNSLVSVVIVPAGMSLPGHECHPEGAASACRRATPNSRQVPLIVSAPLDLPGLILLALTLAAGVAGFVRAYRRRAAEIVEALRAEPVPASEVPGGAYRAPPLRAVDNGVDVTGARRALGRRAAGIVVPAVLSTVALAWFASGLSPWPMPSLTAAWVALVGLAAGHSIARG